MSVRRRLLASCIAALLLGLAALAAHASPGAFDRYERAALPDVTPPNVRVEVLPNGMRVYLLPDHTVPVIKVRAIVRGGAIYDPAEEVGLAELMGMLMRSGGAGERTPQQFDAAVDALGAIVGMDMGNEMGSATLQVLAGDLEPGLRLFLDMLFAPRLDPSRLAAAKLNLEEQLRRQDDDPESLAAYKFRQLVYGEASPWARRADADTIQKISVEKIAEAHRNFFKANNILIAAAGDFEPASFLRLLKELTRGAPAGKVLFPEVAPVQEAFAPATEKIDRPVTQAFIRTGHLGIKRDNPDKFPLYLLDEILGAGSFKSRLMDEIRVKRGMAYHAFSSIAPGRDLGLVSIGVNTKAAQADAALSLVREQMDRLVKAGDITAAEIAFAKQSILSRFVFEFDRPFKVVEQRARFSFYGYPDDYWRVYRDHIVAAGLADLKRVGARYLHPDALRTVIVGPKGRP